MREGLGQEAVADVHGADEGEQMVGIAYTETDNGRPVNMVYEDEVEGK